MLADAAPEKYLDAPIPTHLKNRWATWEAAAWRQAQYRATNRLYVPDERFNVRPPAELCPTHHRGWLDYRNMHFDPVTGNRWPGYDGSPFLPNGTGMDELREQRRVEWDEKASNQMQLIERICLSGRSPQCGSLIDGAEDHAELPRPIVNVPLPEPEQGQLGLFA